MSLHDVALVLVWFALAGWVMAGVLTLRRYRRARGHLPLVNTILWMSVLGTAVAVLRVIFLSLPDTFTNRDLNSILISVMFVSQALTVWWFSRQIPRGS